MSDKPEQTTEDKNTMHYQICVKGLLSQHWSDWFDGMSITTNKADGTSLLTGKVIDQAALYRLLRKVRDAGLQLESLTRIEAHEPSEPQIDDK